MKPAHAAPGICANCAALTAAHTVSPMSSNNVDVNAAKQEGSTSATVVAVRADQSLTEAGHAEYPHATNNNTRKNLIECQET